MHPIAADQSHGGLALNEVFGSNGQVQLLRILATETDGSIASSEVAARAGMTPSGARKALRRLTAAGVVVKVGTGRSTRYVLRREGELAEKLVRLFELERESVDPGWARVRGRRGVRVDAQGGNGNGGGNGVGEAKVNGPPKLNGDGASRADLDLDPTSPEFHEALVTLLAEDLSLINRAREKVLDKLEHRHPGNGHDLWEWRKIFDTYPLPRLLHFLESDSPRAIRLRKSSPFPDVITDHERERIGELVDRVH